MNEQAGENERLHHRAAGARRKVSRDGAGGDDPGFGIDPLQQRRLRKPTGSGASLCFAASAVAIFQASHSRNAAPAHFMISSKSGCRRMRLPRPRATANISVPMPAETPKRHPAPRQTPTAAPVAVSRIFPGPGVMAATTEEGEEGRDLLWRHGSSLTFDQAYARFDRRRKQLTRSSPGSPNTALLLRCFAGGVDRLNRRPLFCDYTRYSCLSRRRQRVMHLASRGLMRGSGISHASNSAPRICRLETMAVAGGCVCAARQRLGGWQGPRVGSMSQACHRPDGAEGRAGSGSLARLGHLVYPASVTNTVSRDREIAECRRLGPLPHAG